MSLQGRATREGTERYRDRLKERANENHFRHEQNLWLSSIGLGTYLGKWDEQTDRAYTEAVVRAVELGVNVIDTAANYRFQRSERSIGAALAQLIEQGRASRDELLICTKGGYLPFDGQPPRDARRYFEETFVETGVASFADLVAGSHCMTPRYLEHQINQSLRNLGLETIDVYYVHNPESQLQEVSREEFDERITRAFEMFEQMRQAGRIRMYGAATWNGFRAAQDGPGHLSLERMAGIARSVGGEAHGFRFVQLPFNLAMPEALVSQNQSLNGERVSMLEAATALGITVVASASILQGKVARNLPEDVREPLGALATDAQTAIQFVRSTPGITTALVGMSRVAHVEENLQLARIAPALPEDYQRLFKNSDE
ncbi:MAG TPA: aldo/keto reductase [Pyrinomonadaceae bacterium]|jgi:aryl-alcohol dehydrogenase-like predicted oxidoreductase